MAGQATEAVTDAGRPGKGRQLATLSGYRVPGRGVWHVNQAGPVTPERLAAHFDFTAVASLRNNLH